MAHTSAPAPSTSNDAPAPEAPEVDARLVADDADSVDLAAIKAIARSAPATVEALREAVASEGFEWQPVADKQRFIAESLTGGAHTIGMLRVRLAAASTRIDLGDSLSSIWAAKGVVSPFDASGYTVAYHGKRAKYIARLKPTNRPYRVAFDGNGKAKGAKLPLTEGKWGRGETLSHLFGSTQPDALPTALVASIARSVVLAGETTIDLVLYGKGTD